MHMYIPATQVCTPPSWCTSTTQFSIQSFRNTLVTPSFVPRSLDTNAPHSTGVPKASTCLLFWNNYGLCKSSAKTGKHTWIVVCSLVCKLVLAAVLLLLLPASILLSASAIKQIHNHVHYFIYYLQSISLLFMHKYAKSYIMIKLSPIILNNLTKNYLLYITTISSS